MKYTICTLALLMALPLVVHAQELRQWRGLDQHQTDTEGNRLDGLRKLHLTDKLANSPEGRQALEDFHRRKALGLLPGPRKSTDTVGDTLTFRVRNGSTGGGTDNIDFKLMDVDPSDPPRFQIWVELAELDNGRITELEIGAIVDVLANRTPAPSADSTAGIIELNERVFGEPPDIDGDGVTDVLILDIRDDFDPVENRAWLAGFVTAADFGSAGNSRDILYLDSDPTLELLGLGEMEQTAAHEYQHLIHFNYDLNELTFVNEGLSEWAEVLCGYRSRAVDYLDEEENYNVPFLRFSSETFQSIDDRERGAMFINYIADRFGTNEPGVITRQSASGSAGIRDALIGIQAGISYEQLLFDFHIANFLNDTSLNPIYGYTTEQRLGLMAMPGASYDGRTTSETPATSADVKPGGVQYLVWEQVEDFSLSLNALAGVEDLRALALLFQDGSFETHELSFGNTPTLFHGQYERIAVAVVHTDPDFTRTDGPDDTDFEYSATWTLEQTISLVTIQYDNGQADAPNGPNPFFGLDGGASTGGAATRFLVPLPDRGTTLDKVFLNPFYLSQFSNGGQPPSAPRDLTLKVWMSENGVPGTEIFSLEMEDPRAFQNQGIATLNPFEVDLSSFAAELSSLPDTIFIGYANAGADANALVAGVSPYNVENVSFITSDVSTGNWRALWTVQFVGGDPNEFPVSETVIPIRAQFAVVTAVATDDEAEVPESIVLYPNFPNPFNPTTSIRYALPQAAEVRLAIYDVLGRQVTVLVEGMKPPGEHVVEVDAGPWASGLYFYSIEAGGQRQTQRMMLIK